MEEHDLSALESAPDPSGDDASQGATPMTQSCGPEDPDPADGSSPTAEAGADAHAMALALSWRAGYAGSSYAPSAAWPAGAGAPAGVYLPYPPAAGGQDAAAAMHAAHAMHMGAAHMGAAHMGAYGQPGYPGCGPPMAQLVMPMCGRGAALWRAPMAEATLSGYPGMLPGEDDDDDPRLASARKNAWSREEDDILARVVEQYGASKWTKVAAHLPGRMGKQCRERWFNHLTPEVKKGAWSPEEDDLIMRAVQQHGTKWSVIVKQLPGRSDNAIKNRYYSAVRKANRQGKRTDDSPTYTFSRPESGISASGIPRTLTAQAIVAAQTESFLPVAPSAYAAPLVPGFPPEPLAPGAVTFGPAPPPAGCAAAEALPVRDCEGSESVHPNKRQWFQHGAQAAFRMKSGREGMGSGEALSVEQEAASLSLVAAVRLSKEEEVEAFAGIDAPVEEDMPLSSLHAPVEPRGRRWGEDNLDIPEAVAVVSSTPLTA